MSRIKNNKKKLGRHDSLVEIVLQRICSDDKYDLIESMCMYSKGGFDGEVDVLAYNVSTGWWHFYEIKCSMTVRSVARALKQYRRFCMAFPSRSVKGVLVSYRGVRRLRQ